MIPFPFEYAVAESAEHAIELLGQGDNAKLLAGGHSLVPLMKSHLVEPTALIDIGRIREHSFVRELRDELAIGALTRYCDIESSALVQQHCPLLSYAAGLVGDLQVRHRGTIGGAMCHGDPAGDLPTVLLALEARLHVVGRSGERVIPVEEFFLDVMETALERQELLTEIRFRKLGGAGWNYQRSSRRAEDWPTVAVAAIVRNDEMRPVSIALANMGPTPLRGLASEAAYADSGPVEAGEQATVDTAPPSDFRATADYRCQLARVLVRRALEEVERQLEAG